MARLLVPRRLCDEDVLRLEVSVDDVPCVAVRETGDDLRDAACGDCLGESAGVEGEAWGEAWGGAGGGGGGGRAM